MTPQKLSNTILIISALFLFTHSSVQAAGCEITLNSISRNRIHACVGEFSSESDLGNAMISTSFPIMKNLPIGGFKINSISGFKAIQAPNQTYYTCFTMDINPDAKDAFGTNYLNQATSINVAGGSKMCNVTVNPTSDTGKKISSDPVKNSKINTYNVCQGAKPEDVATCNACDQNSGVWTALGCISANPTTFIAQFLQIAIGIAGGIALLLMVMGAFKITTSAGDPKKADEGKEIITGTIAGLLFIIFSVVLLNFIGVQILKIPGF